MQTNTQKEDAYQFAYKLYEKKEFSQSCEILSHLTCLYPSEYLYWFSFSACLQALKEFEKACKGWAIAHALKQDDPYPLFHSAECHLFLHKKQKALSLIKQCEKKLHEPHILYEKIANLKAIYDITC